jgi:hypothetical protein
MTWAESRLLRSRFPKEPRNTVSNVAYLVAGLTLIPLGTGEAYVFTFLMAILAGGSFAFHGWDTPQTRKLDHYGMHAVFIALPLYGMGGPWWLLLPGAVVEALVTYRSKRKDVTVGIGMLVGMAYLLAWFQGNRKLTLWSLGFFLVAFGVWWLDRQEKPVTGLWGHAAWHVLTSAAIVLLFRAQP